GLEQNRLAMLLAVLHRHAGIPLHDQDVFVNVVGGVRVTETAADTALILAALSSFRDQALANDIITFGEIGLAGEIRPVPNGLERLREAAKHGFKRAIIPTANKPKKAELVKDDLLKEMQIIGVNRVDELLSFCQQE
ncbi:MAG: DNA repair protein RadA, partial [Gammaproteobacteria bacterium]|nr:DNA repair protein RadA [Gammaproteobacteria bacterium]